MASEFRAAFWNNEQWRNALRLEASRWLLDSHANDVFPRTRVDVTSRDLMSAATL